MLESELQLQREKVFIAVAEHTLAKTPNTNIEALIINSIKPKVQELKEQVRNERISEKAKFNRGG